MWRWVSTSGSNHAHHHQTDWVFSPIFSLMVFRAFTNQMDYGSCDGLMTSSSLAFISCLTSCFISFPFFLYLRKGSKSWLIKFWASNGNFSLFLFSKKEGLSTFFLMWFQVKEECDFNINNIVLPAVYSKRVQDAIENGTLGIHENRLLFVRESVDYFEIRLPRPTFEQYAAISRKFCDTYPVLRSPHHTNYWVCSAWLLGGWL